MLPKDSLFWHRRLVPAEFGSSLYPLELALREMGSHSGEPSQEAFWRGKAAGYQELRGGLGGLWQNSYCVEVIEDASLVEGYWCTRPPYCAVLLTRAKSFKTAGGRGSWSEDSALNHPSVLRSMRPLSLELNRTNRTHI